MGERGRTYVRSPNDEEFGQVRMIKDFFHVIHGRSPFRH